jgi:hypothetical protein
MMSDSSVPLPKYSIWQSINIAISLGMRALEEIRAIASRPPPRDGFGFDDLSVEYDGERCITFKFMKGGDVKEFPIHIDVLLDRGVYRDDSVYQKSDVVTWGGSLWIAQVDSPGHPRDGSSWRLSVKAGRDGRKM